MIQFNLLPDIKKEYINAKKSKALIIGVSALTSAGSIGLIILLFLYVFVVQQLQTSMVTTDIKKKSDTLNGIQDLSKYLTIQSQLASLPSLHDQKGAYMRLFSFLPLLNPGDPNNIKLSNLQLLASDKTIVFTGTTATFQGLNIFADSLRNAEVSYKEPGATTVKKDKMFDSTYVQSSVLSRVSGGLVVSFSIRTVYRDYVFDIRNSDVNASVPNIKTTQSITESPKSPLFDAPKSGGQ
jgi:hypothetical protein